MTDDIVKRLRGDLTGCNPQLIGADAADEIEKLRAELDAIKSPPDYGTQKIMNEQIHNAGLAMRAMDLFRKQADEFEKLRKSLRDMTTRYSEGIGERNKLRAALKPFALAAEDLDDGETGAIWERPCAMNITCDDLRNCQGIFDGSTIEQSSTVRAAKAALGE